MAKILDVRWFYKVGVVRLENPDDGIKYRIGNLGRLDDAPFERDTESEDAKYIAWRGSRFPDDAGDVLFGVK